MPNLQKRVLLGMIIFNLLTTSGFSDIPKETDEITTDTPATTYPKNARSSLPTKFSKA
ncbi:MAG: hypothetical protein LBD57_01970 [Endomicrobium sp.]|nr:hypothetical protein [Endomicrobium sp.]